MAQAQAQAAPTRTHLTLKGSTALVHEFFSYSVQSILYQRSIYPSEDFRTVKKFGLQMLATTDDDLADYLDRAMAQLKTWLEQGKVRRLVVAIVEKESQETVERWQFDIEVVNEGMDATAAYVPHAHSAKHPWGKMRQSRSKRPMRRSRRKLQPSLNKSRHPARSYPCWKSHVCKLLTQARSRSLRIPTRMFRFRWNGQSRTRDSSPKAKPSR